MSLKDRIKSQAFYITATIQKPAEESAIKKVVSEKPVCEKPSIKLIATNDLLDAFEETNADSQDNFTTPKFRRKKKSR